MPGTVLCAEDTPMNKKGTALKLNNLQLNGIQMHRDIDPPQRALVEEINSKKK